MKHAKNQHTVPCLYLHEFAVEPGARHRQIYTFDKTYQRVHRTSIRNVAAEVHFYERGDTGIEKGLQRFEDLFVGPYRRLLTVDKPSDLTQEEVAAVIGFLTVQSMRTREVRELAKSNRICVERVRSGSEAAGNIARAQPPLHAVNPCAIY